MIIDEQCMNLSTSFEVLKEGNWWAVHVLLTNQASHHSVMALPLIASSNQQQLKYQNIPLKFPKSELIVVMQVLNIPQNVGPNENYIIMYLCSLSLSYKLSQ